MPKMPEAEKKEESAESIEEKKEQVGTLLFDIFHAPKTSGNCKIPPNCTFSQNLASGNLNC